MYAENTKQKQHSPSTRENILIFHQNPLQHPISALSASHVIIYCVYVTVEGMDMFDDSDIIDSSLDSSITNRIV